jgi:hypothetical protein
VEHPDVAECYFQQCMGNLVERVERRRNKNYRGVGCRDVDLDIFADITEFALIELLVPSLRSLSLQLENNCSIFATKQHKI